MTYWSCFPWFVALGARRRPAVSGFRSARISAGRSGRRCGPLRFGGRVRVLGIHVAGGVVFYGAATPPGDQSPAGALVVPVEGAPDRIEPAASLDGAERLADFANRIRQDLRDVAPDTVALVATRQHAGWTHKLAFDRISLVSAAMLMCVSLDVPFVEVKTELIGKKTGVPAKSLETIDPVLAGFRSKPLKWGAGRAQAFGAAIATLT